VTQRTHWLELTADYRCNNRCVGCFAVNNDGPTMSPDELRAALVRGRREGATSLWLGGGEPTLRPDLFGIAAAARKIGYTRVRLQTNGMLLSYPEYVQRSRAAGVTEVSFSVKGARADTHDRLARTPGSHAMMLRGIENAVREGLGVQADILAYRSNVDEIVEMVRAYTPMGVSAYRVWLLSAADGANEDVSGEVPTVTSVVAAVTAAMDLGLSSRDDFVTSLHTPACTVPRAYHRCLFYAAELGLLVAGPGGDTFRLEASRMEGGSYGPECDTCSARPRCLGFRSDYRVIHGDAEFRPRA